MHNSEDSNAYASNTVEPSTHDGLHTSTTRNVSFSLESNANFAKTTDKKRIIILCAVDEEYKIVRKVFKFNSRKHLTDKEEDFGFRYNKDDYKHLEIILIPLLDKSMVSVASVATSAIAAFRPKLIALTGTCAGRKGKTQLGDIVIAKCTFNYEAGKIEKDQKRHCPDPISIPKGLRATIQYIDFSANDLTDSSPLVREGIQPDVHFKHIASGSSDLCNPDVFESITKEQDEVFGVDVDAYGLAYAADFMSTVWIVLKGVEKFADAQISTINQKDKECAAYSSALLLKNLLDSDEILNSI